ncbi:kinesin-related protein 4 [Venturia canescens]|uniref:kinesin-related protein 4 n=1 Tax=Venturia canescens TaxID=32260 RepID=UPI001C9C3580|nr:kinesin-related protein 4 [Venturia canescens]
MDSIKVAIKVRPLIKREKEENLLMQWAVQDNSIAPLDPELKKRGEPFFFDHIFDTCRTNYDVFDVIAKPIVEAAMTGINGTIFAYGQTGSGKTYTMMGEENFPGVIPLSIDYIFDRIAHIYDREFLLRVSYIEIYNEKINDLLDKERIDLKINEDKSGQITVKCKEEVVNCPENVTAVMKKGLKNRKIGETNMNEKSSRSHTIFRITIEGHESNSNGAVHISQLNLVDLAGSERIKQTGATGERLIEGRHINLSLSTLSRVIMYLSESQDNPQKFVNFRDSKLTRILQASLGGNAMTTIICAVTPAALEETQATLAFASRAKKIHNKPEVNRCLSDAALLKRYKKQLAKLEDELERVKGANFEEMESMLMEKESKLMEKDRAYQLLEERIELLKTRIVSGNSAPEDQSFKCRSKRRRTWCGPGAFQTKLSPLTLSDLPTIEELDKSPDINAKKKQRKKRQSIIQSIDIPNQTFQTAFTDFELELIESERLRNRFSDVSSGGDDDFTITKRPLQRNVKFLDDVAVMEEERSSSEVSPEKKKTDSTSPDTPKAVLRSRIDFLREQFVSLKDDHSSIREYTTLERQMFVDEAVEAAMVEHNKTVELLKQQLADSEKSNEILQKELAKSTNSVRTLKNENESLVHELNKLKSSETTTQIELSKGVTNDKEMSSIFANNTYFDEMEVSDSQCDSSATNDTANMESILITDINLSNDTTINKMDESKKSKDNCNASYSEFVKQIAEKSSEELIRITQDLFNTKLSLEEENAKLEATLRQKIREADDVKNDIRELKSGIEKLQETIQILTTENTDLTSKLTHEKEFAKEAEKSFQSTIAELNSSIATMTQEKIAMEKSMKELNKNQSSATDEKTLNLMEEYKQTIISLTSENIELSTSLMSLTEDLDLLKAQNKIAGEHECEYRQSMIGLVERNKSLENENIEISNNLMDKIEEYDSLKKDYELLCNKLSSPSQQNLTQNLLNFSMTRTSLPSNEVTSDPERLMITTNGATIDDLLRLSLPANDLTPDKASRTNEAIDDLLQMSALPVENLDQMEMSKEESIEQWKLKAQMLHEQVIKLTLINEKLRNLKITSCKQCAHSLELRQTRKMLESEVKSLTRTLEDLQRKFDRDFVGTEILRTKASEDMDLSVCDSSFDTSVNLDASSNVSVVEERVQSLRSQVDSLKAELGTMTNLCLQKCNEIDKLQDTLTRESSPVTNVESPRTRRNDSKFEKAQTEIKKLQDELRTFKKRIASITATLQKFDNIESMQTEIENLKSDNQMLEKKLMETKSFSMASEKCELLENKVTSLTSDISTYESMKAQLEREKSLLITQIEKLTSEKVNLEEKLIEESKALSIAQEKIQAMEIEVARLNSEIATHEAASEELKNTKSSLDTEVQTLRTEKQLLQDKLMEIEISMVPKEKVDSLTEEVARMSSEIKNHEMVIEQMEEAKLNLETEIQRLKAEKNEGNLSIAEQIVKKDETIETLKNDVSRLISDLESLSVVKYELDNSKSLLEEEIQKLKTEKDEEKLLAIEETRKKDETIEALTNEVSRLISELENVNAVKSQLEESKLSLEKEIQTLETGIAEEELATSQLIAQEDSTVAELQNKVDRLTSEIENFDVVQSQLQNSKSSLETEMGILKAEKDEEILSMTQLIVEKDSTIEELENKIARLTSQFENLDVVKSQLEEAKSSLETEIKTLKIAQDEEMHSMTALIAEKDSKIEELENRVADLISQIDNSNVVESQLEEVKSSLEMEIKTLKTAQDEEKHSMAESIAEKDSKIQDLEKKITDLISQVDESDVVKGQLEQVKSSLESEIETFKAQKEKDHLSTTELIATKNSTIAELEDKVAFLTTEIENCSASKKKLELTNLALETEINSLKIEKESFEESLKNEKVSAAEAKVECLEDEVSRLNSQIDNLETAKTELEEAKSHLENEVRSLRAENETFKQDLLAAERIIESQEKIALEEKVESLMTEKSEIEQSLTSLRDTVSKLDEKNSLLSEELRSIKAEKLVPGRVVETSRSNDSDDTDSSIFKKKEKTPSNFPYEKHLEELESAKKSIRKEIRALKPSTEGLNLEEKSTSELFGFFVTTIMTKEQEVVKALSDNFEREKRKLEERQRQSIDGQKRASVWAKELEAEIEKNQQDLTRQELKNAELARKISSLENLLLETNHENQMLKEKMKVLEADFDTMEMKPKKTPESRQNSAANASQDKERFIRENVNTRELELSSKLRQAEKQYKEKLDELTSNLEHLKTRNIDLSNNLEGLEANERQLKNIVDMRTNELAKCNSTIARIQSELDLMRESYSQSSRDNATKDEKIAEITNLLKTKCDKLSEYKTRLETITPEYEQLKEQATERQMKLEKYKSQIECMTAESEKTISSLKDRLDAEEIESVGYRKQLAELTNRNTTLQMELVELRAKCDELETSNAKLAKSMRNSTSKIRAEEEMEELRDRNRTLERNLDGAGNRINELQDIKTRLTKELVDLRVQYETTNAQNEELQSVLSSHRSNVADTIEWREKYEALLQEKSRTEMELMDKKNRFIQMEKRIENLAQENEELKTKNSELDAEMDDIVSEINELRKENGKLDDQLYNTQNTLESYKSEIKELTTKNLDFERKEKDYIEEIQDLKIQRNKLRCENGMTYKNSAHENSELRTKLPQLDRGDSLTCGDNDRSSSPTLVEAARVINARRRSRTEFFNTNRSLQKSENEDNDNCTCDIQRQRCSELEKDLALKNAKIATLEIQIQSEIFPHMRKCKDLEEIVASLMKKNKTLKAEVRNLQETRAREIEKECERCKRWKQNKRDQASQCLPESGPIQMSGMSSGIVEMHTKNTKLEKERTLLMNLCKSRAKKNIELEKSNAELKQRILELERGTANSSTFNAISIPDPSHPSREAMKENVPAIWEHPKQSSNVRRNWFH